MQQIIKSSKITDDLTAVLNKATYDKLFVLTDEHTDSKCYPLISSIPAIQEAKQAVIPANDSNKNLDNLSHVWNFLTTNGATRYSLLINLGGGMITDLGGFAAATFKRGIAYINIPTTLLGSVDASVGGKTGINFGGYKNEIGAFHSALHVIISAEFLNTLTQKDILSGYAEMIKHALLDSVDIWDKTINFNLQKIDYTLLNDLVMESVLIKQRIVEQDPYEKNIRKALNLGHTIGHAFESFALERNTPVPHGYAVAWGLVAELYLSHKLCNFPKETLDRVSKFILQHYGALAFAQENYDTLYKYMVHDKKNVGDTINFTLLSDIGEIQINQTADKGMIEEALDYLIGAY
ncbi:MAG TPA: 3-dehydroquinate synthase [Dysgonamonadaceae bacterium]|nr:3-dehydroquinate synthase [Dysgonamonadaceae bacterium]